MAQNTRQPMTQMHRMNLRRLRRDTLTRDLVKEIRLSHRQMIQPHFVVDGLSQREPIPGLTGVYRETSDTLIRQVAQDIEKGADKVLIFGVPAGKSEDPVDFSFTAEQVRRLKKEFGEDLWVSVDVCLCSLTSHGHCGVLSHEGDHVGTHVNNRATVERLAQAALAYAQAGADCVAPSDMMDGRVAAIRVLLDGNGLETTLLMSYSAKFHSKFYGPFRAAADSAPRSGLKDRATYQIDPARPSDALQSSLRDAAEGADILMVKPGLPYLDVLADLSRQIPKPWAVYEVSGEYAAIEALAALNLISAPEAHLESWTAFARAGASIIITYGARHAREWLEGR